MSESFAPEQLNSKPWLTVVMPTYNGKAYLAQALDSVAREPLDGVEILVSDDGSSDGTVDMLQEAAERLPLRIVATERVGGWVANTNRTIAAAQGTWISMLHQDDLWLPGRLARLRSAIRQHPDAALIVHDTQFIDVAGRPLGSWRCPLEGRVWSPRETIDRLIVQNFLALPAATFPRERAEAVGRLDPSLWYTGDWDLWLKLAATGPTVHIAEELACFRVHEVSQTVQGSRKFDDFERQQGIVLEKHLAAWSALGGHDPNVERAARAAVEVNCAFSEAFHGAPAMRVAGRFTRLSTLLASPGAARRFARDTRIHERVGARLRAKLDRSPGTTPTGSTAPSTAGTDYAERLVRHQTAAWKRALDVQAPYRWHLRSLELGWTLDVGCGIGRNLEHLRGSGVGVDHNREAIAIARQRGFHAYTADEFSSSEWAAPAKFDSLLVSHVLEHLDETTGLALLREYLPFIRPGGRVVLLTPQEVGQASDATHVRFVDGAELARMCSLLGLSVERNYSFPFPRPVGRVFTYNESVVLARVPSTS